MRIIDRYLLREFAVAFAYCLLAFIVLHVVFEMFETLREFLTYKSPPLLIARYYLLILPAAIEVITPVALFFGLLFALVNMSKNNELIAMRAAGLSLPRMCATAMLIGLAAAVGMFAISEMVAPASSEEADELHDEEKLRRKIERGKLDSMSALVKANLTYVNHREHRKWRFGTFNPKTLSGEDVIIEWSAPGREERKVHARFAYWVGDHWLFQKVKLIQYPKPGAGTEGIAQEYHPTWEDPAINDLPEDIILFDKKQPDYMTLAELRRYLELHPKEELAEIRLNLQRRFAYPWTCVVACLMAIPLGAGMGRRSSLVSVAVATSLFVAYFLINYVSLAFGREGKLDAAFAAWLANGLFTLLGMWMVWRVR